MDGLLHGPPPRSWSWSLGFSLAMALILPARPSAVGQNPFDAPPATSPFVRLPPIQEDARNAPVPDETEPSGELRRLGPPAADEAIDAVQGTGPSLVNPFRAPANFPPAAGKDQGQRLGGGRPQGPSAALAPAGDRRDESAAQVAATGEQDLLEAALSPSHSDSAILWWDAHVRQPLDPTVVAKPIALEEVLLGALNHAAQIRVIKQIPLIRQTAIQEAGAEFDWMSFVESQWIDTSEPVGNRLTTGGPTRFRDDYVSASAGVRRRNRLGGKFELAQRIGHQQNNSLFFDPPNQGTSRLTVSYTQPLLRGAGQAYNTSLIILAEMDTAASRDDVSAQLQAHLLEVAKAYWGLYLERGLLLQKRRLHTQAAAVLRELERRRNIDALHSQIIRARAAEESRRADIVRAEMSVLNAESRIRSLVNDPALDDSATRRAGSHAPAATAASERRSARSHRDRLAPSAGSRPGNQADPGRRRATQNVTQRTVAGGESGAGKLRCRSARQQRN